MNDATAINTNLTGQDRGFGTVINKAIGNLSGFTGALKVTGAAVVTFGAVQMARAVSGAQEFETVVARLNKVAGEGVGEALARQVRDLSRTLPVAADQLFDVTEAAIRLGVTGRDNILEFVETMAMVENVTDMTALQATEDLARLATAIGVPQEEIKNLASTINELSDQMGTSFSEVVQSAGRMGTTLNALGASAEEIIAIAAAQNEVNVSVRQGATQLRAAFQQMDEASRQMRIAENLGMTTEAFRELVKESPIDAVRQIATAMQESDEVMSAMRDTFDSAAREGLTAFSQNLDSFEGALVNANREFREANSLTRQFAQFAGTADAQQQLLRNSIEATRAEIGEELLPAKKELFDLLLVGIERYNELRDAADPRRSIRSQLGSDATDELFSEILSALGTGGAPFGHEFRKSGRLAGEMYGQTFMETFSEEALRLFTGKPGINERIAGLIADDVTGVIDGLATDLEGKARERFARIAFDQFLEDIAGADASDLQRIRGEWTLWANQFAAGLAGASRATDDAIGDHERSLKAIEKLQRSIVEMYGLVFEDLESSAISAITSIHQQRIELEQGEEAARRFELSLQGITGATQNVIIAGERRIEQLQEEARRQEEVADVRDRIDALNQEYQALKQGGDAADLYRITQTGIPPVLAPIILALERKIEAHHQEQRAKEAARQEADRFLDSLNDEYDQLFLTERQLFENKLATMDLTEEQRRQARVIRMAIDNHQEWLDSLTEEEEKVNELQRRMERFDLSSFDNQMRLLADSVNDFTDATLDAFEAIVSGSESAGDAFRQMLRTMTREIMSMMLNHQVMRFFSTFMQGQATGGGFSPMSRFNVGTGTLDPITFMGRTASGNISPTSNVSPNINFNVNAIDAKGVSQFFNDHGKTVAGQVVTEINKSNTMKRSLGK